MGAFKQVLIEREERGDTQDDQPDPFYEMQGEIEKLNKQRKSLMKALARYCYFDGKIENVATVSEALLIDETLTEIEAEEAAEAKALRDAAEAVENDDADPFGDE